MASSMIFSYEKRPLKRPKLGPPDVYPQDPKQREDELTAVNVKQGFSHMPLSDEFGTAKNCNISAAKLGAFMNGALNKKGEANTLPDTGKRRPQVNTKDHFWHVTHTPKHKQALETWMKDLAGGRPLSAISKKVPIFNKREEIFLTLAEYNVPMIRAAWFLKMTASYNSAISEAKTKKRQMPDPSQEWTISLARCCKEILLRLTDWYGGGIVSSSTTNLSNQNMLNSPSTGSSTPNHTSSINGPSSGCTPGGMSFPSTGITISEDGSVCLRQWLYCIDLAKYLYEEGLLDRYEWLVWVIDICDKTKSVDDPSWKALLPVMLSFLPDIAQSELLSRRLSTLSARKLSSIFTDDDFKPVNGELISPPSGLIERLKCPTHRSTVLGLCSAIQVVLLDCPTAMVYNANPMAPQSESGRNSVPGGSPLDILPIPPSVFPMPSRINNSLIREKLAEAENSVIARSRAVEAKWSCEEWQQSSAGTILQKVLSALDALDRYCFDKNDTSNSIDILYTQVFPNSPIKDNPSESDAPIILLLCQWAVSAPRFSEHRALAVARLLEHRQSDILSAADPDNQNAASSENTGPNGNGNGSVKTESPVDDSVMNEAEFTPNGQVNGYSNGNASNNPPTSTTPIENDEDFPNGLPVYHNLLFKYLDSNAPVIDESSTNTKTAFPSLVNLFSSLIRHDVFSHDAYLCTLIARGDLNSMPPSVVPQAPPSSVQPIPSVATPGPASQAGPATPASVTSVTPGTTPHHDLSDDRGPLFPPLPRIPEMPRQTEFDDQNIDDDLDRLLQHITQEQQNMDQVDSPREEPSHSAPAFGSITPNPQAPLSNSTNSSDPNANSSKGSQPNAESKQSRHRQYVTHFQLPQDDSYSHEANQRHILLYGVGKSREEAKHAVKKVSKEVSKLFNKKFCYDVADGSRVKKHSKNELNLEALQSKYAALPYYDQHSITSAISQTACEMISGFASGRSNYLPTVEHIGYLSDLMEIGLNITGLLELCASILKDLADIYCILSQRGSSITASYTANLLLHMIAILRRYHCCLLLDNELISSIWDSLSRLLRNSALEKIENTSAERCTIAYVIDLQSCCGVFRSKNISDLVAKLRQNDILCPPDSSHNWNQSFMTQCLEYPKRKVESSILRQLNENSTCRFSFVCNAVLSICNEADPERVNDLASLCAEITAACPSLTPEWLRVLQTLCSPSSSRHCIPYTEILNAVDVKNRHIHSSLATLTALLVARQCFSFEDFVKQAVFSLLTRSWNDGRAPHDRDTEAGARLTCQLLLSLFKTQDNTAAFNSPNILKLSCDRRLLSATHKSITLGAVCAALKAMLLLADAAGSGERRRDQRSLPGMAHGELSISHILGTSDAPASDRADLLRSEPRTLSSFAYSALQQMCSEPWVRQRCLQNPDDLWSEETLLDPMVQPKQAQRLLHLICYPDAPLPDEGLDPRILIPRLMESLDQWNLREAWLTLTLQNKQLQSTQSSLMEHGNWLDLVARSALDVFNLGNEDGQDYMLPTATPSPAPGKSPRSGKKGQACQDLVARTPPSSSAFMGNSLSASSSSIFGGGSGNGSSESRESERNQNDQGGSTWTPTAAWLMAPLVTKLSTAVQGRVLRHAGNVLEAFFKRKSSNQNSNGSLQAHLPFLALILTCLRGQDEQREGLLTSLLTQFTQILSLVKLPDFDYQSQILRDVLRLRLSLVGGMFDAIQRSNTATAEWAVILTQLVTNNVVDLHNNSDIFPTVVDMITALVHSTQIAEPGDRIEEMKRQNMNLIKKLKKELADRDSDSVKPLRQLLPFSKVQVDVIVTTATSMIIDSKGNRVQSFEFVDKKPGLQVWEKQRVSPWEIIEGQKNPAQLSWGWFGAVKMDRKPLRYEESHRVLRYHTHNLVKPTSHFLESVPLPPEDIDLKPEVVIKEDVIAKPDTPSSDRSPLVLPPTGRKQPKTTRKRRQTKAAANQQTPPISSPSQQPPPMGVVPGGPFNPGMGPSQMPSGPNAPPNYPPGNNPQWYNGNPQPQPQPSQQSYFPNTSAGPGRPPMNTSKPKQVLSEMIRARHITRAPNSGPFVNYNHTSGPQGPRHPNILRQQLRAPPPMQGQNFQGQPGMPPNQNPMYSNQQGMGPGYGFNQGPPVSGPPSSNPHHPHPQMMSQRGPVPNQEMAGFMAGGQGGAGPGQGRPMGQRPGFIPGNQGGGKPGMNPMQGGYARPPMGQGQMGAPGPGMQQQMGQMQNTGQMGQSGMQNPQMNQGMGMGSQGMMPPGQGMPNPNMNPRMRQYVMQQQQQNIGMGSGPRLPYQNQTGGY